MKFVSCYSQRFSNEAVLIALNQVIQIFNYRCDETDEICDAIVIVERDRFRTYDCYNPDNGSRKINDCIVEIPKNS